MTLNLKPAAASAAFPLPDRFLEWFAAKGWSPRAHQLELLARAEQGQSTLLIAPTGAGKTLAGFLPALVDLEKRQSKAIPGKVGTGFPSGIASKSKRGVHTLYISPLKALAVDIHRNLTVPVEEMGLDISIETRTGDTPAHKRQRQKLAPPDILLTTPEQLALLIASKGAEQFFKGLRYVVLDELHSLVISKRGHLLALGLARLRRLQPQLQTIGLSATVAEPDELRRWLVEQDATGPMAGLVTVDGGAKPEISILDSDERVPWSGHSSRYAIPDIYEAIRQHKTTLLFVNTRSQAEMLFRNSGGSMRTRCRLRCIMARLMPASAARSSKPWLPTHCGLWSRPRHLISGSTGAMSIWSFMSEHRRGEPPCAAHRTRQSPHGRAKPRHSGARQSLRGDGVPCRTRRQLSGRAGYTP